MRRFLMLVLRYFRAERVDLETREVGSVATEPKPLVIVASQGSTLRVVDRNAPAEREGIEPGMTLAEAHAGVPSLRVSPHDPAGDERALAWLGDWATRFGPTVHLMPPRAVAVDVGGSAHLFGGEQSVAEQALDLLAQRGFHATAAVAATIGAAYALATRPRRGTESATVIPTGEEAKALGPIPVSALRLDEQDVRWLYSLGVRTVSELLALPRPDLRARFGEPLTRRIAEVLGEIDEALPLHAPADRFHVSIAFPDPIEGGEMLIYAVRKLLEDASDWLLARLDGARRLALEIASECAPFALKIGLAAPARETKRLFALCRTALEGARLSGRVTGLSLEILETAPLPFAQRRLPPCEDVHPNAGKRAVDSIAARLGERAVLRMELVEDHRPERAFRLRAATRAGSSEGVRANHRGGRGARAEPGAVSRGRPPPRPTRLFKIPRPLEVRLDAEQRPVKVQGGGVVRVVRGPERLTGAWWAGRRRARSEALCAGDEERESGVRDYYEVEAANGHRLWIFFERGRERWFLHGVF